MYTTDDIDQLLEIFLPQNFDSVVRSIQTALGRIDPSWRKGQFNVFSKHFRLHFWRSVFVKRFLLNDAKSTVLDKTKLLEKVLYLSQSMSDAEKAAFYGDVLSEYVLLCPIERFPTWADEQKNKPNWLTHWNLHSTACCTIYK